MDSTGAVCLPPQVVIHVVKVGREEVRARKKKRLKLPSSLYLLTNCYQYTRPGTKQSGTLYLYEVITYTYI